MSICFFFFNDTATTEIYTLSLHDALPISAARDRRSRRADFQPEAHDCVSRHPQDMLAHEASRDRKSTRLNSSHGYISYAVFCLKKKKKPLHFHLPHWRVTDASTASTECLS